MTKQNGEISVVCQWDDVFAISGVCQSWREASIDYLNWIKPKIGLVPSHGFAERKLNVEGFLDYLSEDERFAVAETIYVPCGNADKLLYGDVKVRLPAMTKLIHRTWLLVNGNVEYVVQGKGRHPCYRVYKHDKEYIAGKQLGLNTLGMESMKRWTRSSWCKNWYRGRGKQRELISIEANDFSLIIILT
jgi:hypothetical protein